MASLRRQMAPPFIALAFVLCAVAPGVLAQTSAPPPAAPPKHACTSPGDNPGRLASDNQRRNWTKAANAYLECLKKYVAEQKAAADPYINASNAAIDEYNAAAKAINAQIQEASAN